mmetsp:Transcript_1483/g.3745  ORF Transcript_1483/g.3745 Transcript_1483/m.3745 type:complete len:93 (-) Transcript_1483:35-313(-)
MLSSASLFNHTLCSLLQPFSPSLAAPLPALTVSRTPVLAFTCVLFLILRYLSSPLPSPLRCSLLAVGTDQRTVGHHVGCFFALPSLAPPHIE